MLALVVALAGLAPLASGLLTRPRVFSPATVEELTSPEAQPGSHPRTVYDPDGDGVMDRGPTSERPGVGHGGRGGQSSAPARRVRVAGVRERP